MADISSISESELTSRRQRLRRQRRWRTLQSIWQITAVSSLTGGLIWAFSLSDWMLRSPKQVLIEGNQFLSTDNIRSLLPINYPQSLFTLHPQTIAQHLEAEAPIADAVVIRRLFPPGLIVHIQERYPVAIAYLADPAEFPFKQPTGTEAAKPAGKQPHIALLDEEGAWIPHHVYVALKPSQGLPDLKVFGMREVYRPQWPGLYQQVSQSPVRISEIDWRDPNNLILRTELGVVHFGPYGPQFIDQLQVLDQMRQLPEQVQLDQIAYIDLRNPEEPLVEMAGSESVETSP